jgi:PKD repeat protein
MKTILFLTAAGVVSFFSLSAQVKTEWKNSYSDTYSHYNQVAGKQQHVIGSDGSMYIAGQSNSDTSDDTYGLLLKYDTDGNLSWHKILKNQSRQTHVTNAEGCSIISSDNSGRLYVYGHYFYVGGLSAGVQVTETFMCNDSGNTDSWEFGFAGTEGSQQIGPQGHIYQITNSLLIDITRDFLTQNGYWNAGFSDGGAFIQVQGSVLDKINNTYLTCYTHNNDSLSYDLALAKVDSAGRLKWVKKYNYSQGNNRATYPTGIAADDSGNVYLSAYTVSGDTTKGLLLKYAPSGSLTYVREILQDSFSDVKVNDIRMDGKGNLLLTGYAVSDFYRKQMLVKYNPDGSLIWSRLFGANDASDMTGYMLAVDSAGDPIVLSEHKESSSDAVVVKYNPEGRLLWSQTIDIENYDIPQQISVTGNGDIYLSGNGFISDTTANIISAKLSQALKARFMYQKDCAGNVTFSDVSNSPSGTMTYNWDFGDGKSSSDQNPTHEYSSGTYTVKLTVSSRGSSDTYSDTVTIDPLPQACFTVKSNGRKYTFTANDATLADYTWIINNKDTLKGISVTYLAASISETVSVKLIVVNQHGCQNSCSQIFDGIQPSVAPGSVTIYPNPMNGSSVLSFTLLRPTVVSVRATDELGRSYMIQSDKHFSAGTILIPVNIPDASGLINYSLIIDGISQAQIKALKL